MNIYNTNIEKLTCSCPDWKETREQYRIDDPRRLCKHIVNRLDTNNLPYQIDKFKESVQFYQEKEWGFRKDFDHIIELSNFTLLGNDGWIDVFNGDGIRYGVTKRDFVDTISWANNLKPLKFNEVEKYLIHESKKIPLPLEEEEYLNIINSIKEVIPGKKDLHITIHLGQCIPCTDGIIYEISESKLNPEEEEILLHKLLQKYDEDKAYDLLNEANSTLVSDEGEYCIYEPLTVTNNKIIIGMYNGKKYIFERDYEFIKKLKETRELKEILEKETREKLWKEEREREREIAKKKGYLLSDDYHGELYNSENNLDALSGDEYITIKDSVLNKYNLLQNLLKIQSSNITTAKFNKTLKKLDFITKESLLNQNDWILRGDGLGYGINLIKMSKYMHKTIPDWYNIQIFDNKEMKLINFNSQTDVKMTSILFEINKFNELFQLVKQEIEREEFEEINKTSSNKQIEREEWLKNINCPHCGSKNIHKKDKRQRKNYQIQRYQCRDCKKIFQEKI